MSIKNSEHILPDALCICDSCKGINALDILFLKIFVQFIISSTKIKVKNETQTQSQRKDKCIKLKSNEESLEDSAGETTTINTRGNEEKGNRSATFLKRLVKNEKRKLNSKHT